MKYYTSKTCIFVYQKLNSSQTSFGTTRKSFHIISTTRDSRCNTMTHFIISLCLISIVFGISSGFSKESTLKQSLLEYYDPTTKPEGQTTVEISVRPVNMKMCPKSQVHIQF